MSDIQVINQLEWKPNSPKQTAFLSLPDDIFEAMYGGEAGGGKTEVAVMYPLARNFHTHPDFKGIIFRSSYPQLDQYIIPLCRKWYAPFGAKYDDQKHMFKFPSGAFIRLGFIENMKDAMRYDSIQYNYMCWEELCEFNDRPYRFLTHRVRTSTPTLPAIIRNTATPGNQGNNWVRDYFVKPAPDGMKKVYNPISKTYRIYIPAKLTDNPDMMKNDPGYKDRMFLMGEAERRAKQGDWYAFEGQVFEEWRSKKLSDEPANALHVIEPFPVPLFWPKIIAVDWGYTAMTWAGFAAVSPDGRCYMFQEYAVKKTSISNWAREVGALARMLENVVAVELDPSAKGNRGEEKTIKEQFIEHSGLLPNDADNGRLSGKVLMHDFLRWKQRPKTKLVKKDYDDETAERFLRLNGMDAYKEYLRLFQPEPDETNIPYLQVFKNCTRFIDVLPQCMYDDPPHQEDVKPFDGDDPYDGGRYLIKAVHRYINDSATGHDRFTKLSAIEQHLKETGDINTYYRQMENFEVGENNMLLPVRRSRRGLRNRNQDQKLGWN